MIYMADDIKTSTALETVRFRPSLYIGSLDEEGFLKILDDFFIYVLDVLEATNCSLDFKNNLQGSIVFSNIGKNVPTKIGETSWVPGQRGMDAPLVLNALSLKTTHYFLEKDKLIFEKTFEKGKIITEHKREERMLLDKWEIHFQLDSSIFNEIKNWNSDFLFQEIKKRTNQYKGRISFEF